MEGDDDEEVKDPQDYQYKLVGVVIHMGTADAGHYLSYINVDRNKDSQVNTEEWLKTENQQWVEFNDSQVRPFDFSLLAYKCFGEPSGQQDF
jgi:ubiquitin carboxyl-terminal hydrolase 34